MTATGTNDTGHTFAAAGHLDAPLSAEEFTEKLDAIRGRGTRMARHMAAEQGFRRIYTGGAPLAGLGSPCSDIDLFVVLDEGEEDTEEQLFFEGQRVDVEYLRLRDLESLIDRFSSFTATSDNAEQIGFASRSRLDRVTRFLLSEIVVDDGELGRLHAKLTDAGTEFRKLLIARHAQDAQNAAEDVSGAVLNGDLQSAEYQSREMVYFAAEAYLCAAGDLYVNTKWLWAKWARTFGDGGPQDAELATVIRDLGLADPADAVARNIWLAQDLLAMAATGYTYAPVTAPRPAHTRRNPRYTLLPFSDGFVVTQQVGAGVELSREGVLLWGVAHGRPRAEAATAARKIMSEQGLDVSEDDVLAYYDSLVARELIVPARADADDS